MHGILMSSSDMALSQRLIEDTGLGVGLLNTSSNDGSVYEAIQIEGGRSSLSTSRVEGDSGVEVGISRMITSSAEMSSISTDKSLRGVEL